MRFKSALIPIVFLVLLLGGVFWVSQSQETTILSPGRGAEPSPEPAAVPWGEEGRSSDGTIMLVNRTLIKPGEPKTYEFFVAEIVDKQKGEEQPIFTRTVDPKTELRIHHNAWSPNNKYVALEEKDEDGKLNFLILKASGEPFADGEQYLDVGAVFEEKITDYSMDNATGWASPIFFNVTTTKEDGTKGPSYWFDVTARNFWGHR